MRHRLRVWWNMWLASRWVFYYLTLWFSSSYYVMTYYLPELKLIPAVMATLVFFFFPYALAGMLCSIVYDWEMRIEEKVIKGNYIKATGGELTVSSNREELTHGPEKDVTT